MELAQNIQAVRAKIAQAAADAGRTPGEITLCAATKVQTDETIRAAIAAGVQVCGENRVQELTAHLEAGAYEGAGVHFIGHLQTNKVKQVVGKVELIHSVDSERLLRAIHSQAEKLGIVQDILLEVNIAGEESKGGCSPQEAEELARRLSDGLGLPVETGILSRNKNTAPQKDLNPAQRLKNLEEAFSAKHSRAGLTSVILVDDIYTTGSTVEACSRVLKRAGVSRVYFLCICIGGGR